MPSTLIRVVHVIFKTHLDLGFTDSAANVKQAYMLRFIPQALALGRELRATGGDRFVWTTGSWLVYEYLEEAAGAARREMEAGIAAGDISWHALPFTTHTEMMDASLFRFGLSLARDLDRRFGRNTIAAKMTDIPGHTRAMVPLLAEAGVSFLHIGVNPASPAPDVPDVFVWRSPEGASVIVNYSKSDYGGFLAVPGLDETLVFAHTGDNKGPAPAAAIHKTFADLRAQYPGAEVRASTLDAFARRLVAFASTLPTVSGEIGDTWIHGLATDPAKAAGFRALSRWRARHESQRPSPEDALRVKRFSRALICVPEHTWGKDVKTWLGDYVNYDRASFAAARQADEVSAPVPPELEYAAQWTAHAGRRTYSGLEASWAEQRRYLREAVVALGDGPAGQDASSELEKLKPVRPDRRAYCAVAPGLAMVCGSYEVTVDSQTGALCRLHDRTRGRDWADAGHLMGVWSYQTFSAVDYDRYLKDYVVRLDSPGISSWAIPDFSRPGLERSGARSVVHAVHVEGVWHAQEVGVDCLLVELSLPDEAWRHAGAPRAITVEYRFPTSQPVMEVVVQWFDKPANRMPEAVWFAFQPPVAVPDAWRMEKMGQWVSPLEVVRNGNRNLHAIDRGVRYEERDGRLLVESLDAPLVAPGMPRLLQFDRTQPPLELGMHFNLFNNVFPTNFPLWYGEDARFRFVVRMESQ